MVEHNRPTARAGAGEIGYNSESVAQLYDRPVSDLMKEAAAEVSYPARPGDFVAWFRERYPSVKTGTVRAHVTGLTENDNNRHHYRWLARRAPLFTRTPQGELIPFDGSTTGQPDDDEEAEVADVEVDESELEFVLEVYLEEFLLSNFDCIDRGRPLQIWESDSGELGHQYVTDVGRLDFLCPSAPLAGSNATSSVTPTPVPPWLAPQTCPAGPPVPIVAPCRRTRTT